MLEVEFRYTRIIDRFKYQAGKIYQMDDSYAKHPYFLALVTNKEVFVVKGSEKLETNHHAFPKKLDSAPVGVPELKDAKSIDEEKKDESSDDGMPFEGKVIQPKQPQSKGK